MSASSATAAATRRISWARWAAWRSGQATWSHRSRQGLRFAGDGGKLMARLVFKPGAVRLYATTQARKSVRKTTAAVNRQARRNAPGGAYSTGRLKRSINWSVQTSGWNVRGTSGSSLPYAIFPERGADAHIIRASNKPHLKFYWRRVGRWVRFRQVSHPGQEGQNYMTRALTAVAPLNGYRVVIYG